MKFYNETLGLPILFKGEDWSEFDVDGQRLALKKATLENEARENPTSMVWFLAKPIEAIVGDLKRKHVQFIDDIATHSYGKMCRFCDPDGNPLGLYEPPPKNSMDG